MGDLGKQRDTEKETQRVQYVCAEAWVTLQKQETINM